MNTYEYFSVFLAFMSAILGYTAFSQNRKANRLQEKIAQLQGIFDKPQLDILVFHKPIFSHYIYAFPFNNKSFIVPLQLSLLNKGNVRAKNIELYINSPNEIIPHEILELEKTENSFNKTQFKILNRTVKRTTCGFQTAFLEQQRSMVIQFELYLKNSTLNKKGSAPFTSKDNIKAVAKYIFSYSYEIKIWAHSENHSPVSKEIKISVLDTSENSIEDYFRSKATENEKHYKEKLDKLNRLQRIKHILKPNPQLMSKPFEFCYVTSNDIVADEKVPNLFKLKSMEIGFGTQSADGFTSIPSLKMNGYPRQL